MPRPEAHIRTRRDSGFCFAKFYAMLRITFLSGHMRGREPRVLQLENRLSEKNTPAGGWDSNSATIYLADFSQER